MNVDLVQAAGAANSRNPQKDAAAADVVRAPEATTVRQPTEAKAIASLVVGVVSFAPGLGFCLGPIAICLGVQARERIQQSRGRWTGEQLATGGILTGTIGILLSIGGFIWLFGTALFAA